MDRDEMTAFIISNKTDLIVDASHPYAFEVSENAREAAELTGVEYLRFSRSKSNVERAHRVESMDECLEFLKGVSGCVFFTTGSNHIEDFENVRGENRFVYRVLPTKESMEICRKNNVALKDIIGLLGPFSLEMNLSMFGEFKPDYVVMKNSGRRGGTEEKLEACHRLGIDPVIIQRKDETGFSDLDELIKYVMNRRRCHE